MGLGRTSIFPVGSLVVSKKRRRRGRIIACGYVIDKCTGFSRFEITVSVYGETYYVHCWKTFNQIWEAHPVIRARRRK